MGKDVSIKQLTHIVILAVTVCMLVFSSMSEVHAAMDHHGGVSNSIVNVDADELEMMAQTIAGLADCDTVEQDDSSQNGGLNCCSAMCSTVFLVEAVDEAGFDQRNVHFELPSKTATSREVHGFLRPPSI